MLVPTCPPPQHKSQGLAVVQHPSSWWWEGGKGVEKSNKVMRQGRDNERETSIGASTLLVWYRVRRALRLLIFPSRHPTKTDCKGPARARPRADGICTELGDPCLRKSRSQACQAWIRWKKMSRRGTKNLGQLHSRPAGFE